MLLKKQITLQPNLYLSERTSKEGYHFIKENVIGLKEVLRIEEQQEFELETLTEVRKRTLQAQPAGKMDIKK